jgi:molecular chaperone DnaK
VKAALLQPFGSRELQAVVSWLLSQAFEQTGVKVADDKIAYQRIVEAAQKALEQLKTQETATISLPFLTADAAGPKHFETRLTREAIQELIKY